MKILLIAAISLMSVQAFSADLSTTIHNVEVDRNAKCTKVKTSWGLNLGGAFGSTFYTIKYKCISNTGDFGLKVRMNNAKVRKVIFTK